MSSLPDKGILLIYLILSAALEFTQSLTEMNTGNRKKYFWEVKSGR
jgi:hypothetical protein